MSGTGVAIWKNRKLVTNVDVSYSKGDWHDRMNDIAATVANEALLYGCRLMVYEMPMFIAKAAAANARQDIIKLTLLAGSIDGHCRVKMMSTSPIPINSWKGQMEKTMMNDRVRRRYASHFKEELPEKMTTHSLDAIGIGMYILGLL